MKRVCSWCGLVIAADVMDDVEKYAGFVTHSICSACIARVDAQIAAVKEVSIVFACPNCPADASPYKVTVQGSRRLIYVRCTGCDLMWIEEALIASRDSPGHA